MSENIKNYLILGSHAHVPTGAKECEFKHVYETKMRPFVTNLYRYSNIQAVLHYSGILLYWVERNHPEFFMLIEDMISRKQAEILGGGFYEPSFPLIPLQDRIGQIELMTTYLRKHFGKKPGGCRIPGYAWEQSLVTALCASDMNYTFLTQDQFVQAGLKDKQLLQPCLSEDQGKLISVFPVSLSLEKDLETKNFSYVFTLLNNKLQMAVKPEDESGEMSHKNAGIKLKTAKTAKKRYTNPRDIRTFCPPSGVNTFDKIISIFPDKISSSADESPDTAWNRFFEEISLSKNIIETTLPSKILKKLKVLDKGSFPDSSAFGKSPRRFLIENGESGGIYFKMIFTNVLISQLRGDKPRKLNAREELWKAQDSSLFSADNGQLRNDLRKAAYSSLLRAEKLSRGNEKIIPSLIQHDFDLDGIDEFLFQGPVMNCFIQQKGAGIFELDYLPKVWNYLDCGVYSGISCVKETNRRMAFADIITSSDSEIAPQIKQPAQNNKSKNSDVTSGISSSATQLKQCADFAFDREKTRFCYNSHYEAVARDKSGKSCFRLAASNDVIFGFIEINKCYSFKKDSLTVSYILKNTDSNSHKFNFIPEIDFSFAGVTDEFVRFCTSDADAKDISLDKKFETNNLKILDIENEVQIVLSSAKIFRGSLVPVYNRGFYQATCLLPVFSVALNSGESWTNDFSLKFSH